MNIAKALKHKNRLAGEIARNRNIFARENSKKKGETRTTDLAELKTKIEDLIKSLIAIKTAITQASAPIAAKLVTLSESKGELTWVKELPITEGPQPIRFPPNSEPETYEAFLTTTERDKLVEAMQNRINLLQDEIDEFNATTRVAFEE